MEWITLDEAAKQYAVSKSALRDWLQNGLIDGITVKLAANSKQYIWLVNPDMVQNMVMHSDEVTNGQAAAILGISKGRITQLVNESKLDSRDVGGRRFIKLASVEKRKINLGRRT